MGAEAALDKVKEILDDNLENELPEKTTSPGSILIGNYLGREEILSQLPAVTVETQNTFSENSQEEWEERTQELYVWVFLGHVDIEQLHRNLVRYGDTVRKILRRGKLWGDGWHNPSVGNALYTGVFSATHQLVQGCRIEVTVGEIDIE